MHNTGHHDAARICQRLKASRDIDAISINIVAIDDDIAYVDAYAKFNALVYRDTGIALGHTALNVNGAAHCIDHADELYQHPITGRLDDPTAMFGDLGIDQFLAMRFELAQRSLFVDAHEPAITGNVACPDRS